MSTQGCRSWEGVLVCTFVNRLEELSPVVERLLAFLDDLGISGRAAYVANLAVEEMVTNTLKYAYDDDAAHTIGLRVEVQPETLSVCLEDDGHAFDPLTAPEPDLSFAPEERQPGGLGISLVRRLAERMLYERRDGRNRVTIVVRKGAGED